MERGTPSKRFVPRSTFHVRRLLMVGLAPLDPPCTIVVAFLLLVSALAATAGAQKPPALGYAFPPAVSIGETTDVRLGGFDFTPDMEWFVHDERVKLDILGPPGEHHVPPPPYWSGPRTSTPALPIPREVPARISVSEDAVPGCVRWQVANANGSSATAMLYLSRGREIVESRLGDRPQRLDSLPVAVSGRLSRLAEVDRYELLADRDGLVSIDLMARRLGSDFNGQIEVRDAAGKRLVDYADTLGIDGGVTFAVQKGQTYTVALHDTDFRGDRAYVYRLAFRYGPRVIATMPAAGRRGTTQEFELVGYGVASGTPQLESLRKSVDLPSDVDHVSHAVSRETPGGAVDVTIPLSGAYETTRDALAGNDPRDAIVPLAAPVAITGRFPPDVAEHRYAWRAEQDERWTLTAESYAIGGRLDVALAVIGPDGKPIGDNDDAGGTTDAAFTFAAATPGEYTCVVRCMSSRVGALDEIYRLQVARQTPDFALSVPQQVNLPSGGKAELTVSVARLGGFNGPIVLSVDGLPSGVTIEGDTTIPADKNEARLALVAAADAAVVAKALRVRGECQRDGQAVSRVASASAAGNLCPRSAEQQRTDRVLLAVTMTPPVELRLIDHERQRAVHRGTTYRAEFEIVRKDGFMGEVHLEMAAQQARYRQGITGGTVVVPADADRAWYPCFMPEWLPTDLTRRMLVQAVVAVPDPQGRPRHLVQPANGRITMILEGALLKLSAAAGEPTLRPGESFDVPITIARSAKLPLSVKVELVAPEELSASLHAQPLDLPPGQESGTLRIDYDANADASLAGDWPLTLRATAREDGQWPIVSQTEIHVRIDGKR